ncbi:SDR family NAD(P)-dependent oxidoreductase [Spirosoma sp. KUDC1026]|uniref:SDR family NAD(P)-dependent oxidoreductase n=1 Tax=Spirosoma sp. KUDC1026 TaxID=2745947 RepID=UPI00159B8421|nr:glucose 1-dehydrogenase [Spirosoma sp. KUDC1026]QKZ12742.1 glucose 1-dehydrogenase [Spirosoma sp. KUDC1026]
MEHSLAGKTALVTGAASGIGKAIALLYGQHGANVLVSDLDAEKGQVVVEQIKGMDVQAHFVLADVSDPADNERLVNEAVNRYGKLDIACNNAGIGGEQNLIADYSLESWQKVIDINLSGVFYGLKYQLAQMVKQGFGTIVNMASILGQAGTQKSPAYVAAKHGVVGLTKAAALEYADKGIRINAVGPGYIDTPLLKSLPDEAYDGLVGLHPIGRLGKSEEVAELVIWLSSNKASFVTGAYYPIDGGYLAQ